MRWLALLGLLTLGCEDFDQLAKLKPRKVTLRSNDVSHSADGGTQTVPLPAAGAAVCEAWVDVLLEQGWQKIEGSWVADGQCELRNVPPGETLLRVPGTNSWMRVTIDDVDLGGDYFGRAYDSAADSTTVTLDLSNAAPLSSTGLVSMYLPDFGNGLNSLRAVVDPSVGIPMGSTGATSFPVTFKWKGLPLLQDGERIGVFQGVAALATATEMRFVLAKQGWANVQPIDSKNVRASLAMTDLATAATPFPGVSFDPSPFYESVKFELPAPSFLGCFLDQVAVVPGALAGLSVQSSFTIKETSVFAAPSATVDPLPGIGWTRRVVVSAFYETAIGSAAMPPTGTLVVGSSFQGPADELGWLTTAAMTPVRNINALKKDGSKLLLGELESLTPVLVWDPPSQGLPNRYVVQPYEVTVGADDKGVQVVKFTQVTDQFYLDRPECHVPPGILKASSQYVFVITAENCTAADPKRPRRSNLQSTCARTQNRSYLMVAPSQ